MEIDLFTALVEKIDMETAANEDLPGLVMPGTGSHFIGDFFEPGKKFMILRGFIFEQGSVFERVSGKEGGKTVKIPQFVSMGVGG